MNWTSYLIHTLKDTSEVFCVSFSLGFGRSIGLSTAITPPSPLPQHARLFQSQDAVTHRPASAGARKPVNPLSVTVIARPVAIQTLMCGDLCWLAANCPPPHIMAMRAPIVCLPCKLLLKGFETLNSFIIMPKISE